MDVTEYLGILGEQSLYGNASVGYGGFVYIEGTARVDQSSTLKGLNPDAEDTYFYPSVAGTLLIHELGGLKDADLDELFEVKGELCKGGCCNRCLQDHFHL